MQRPHQGNALPWLWKQIEDLTGITAAKACIDNPTGTLHDGRPSALPADALALAKGAKIAAALRALRLLGVTTKDADAASAAAKALSRFPKAARPSQKPPGFNPETWQWNAATRSNVRMDWRDPEGGEWRFHPPDKYHDAHWDYNPWTNWNSPWQHLYPGD